jgi:hypothetical protein
VAKTTLENMTVAELRKRLKQATGKDNKSPNKKFLIKSIKEAEAGQRKAERAARRESIATTESVPLAVAEDAPADDLELEAADAEVTEARQDDGDIAAASSSDSPNDEVVAGDTDSDDDGARVSAPVVLTGDIGADDDGAEVSAPVEVLDDEADMEVATEAQVNLDGPLDADDSALDAPSDEVVAGQPTADSLANAPVARAPRGRFKGMSIAELQTLYHQKVGRPTGSDDRDYMIWKIRAAEKGKITVGAVRRGSGAGAGGGAAKGFGDTPIEELQKLYEAEVGSATDSGDREELVRAIVTAQRAAARAAKRFADVTVGDLQKLYEERTGSATDSEDRSFLIRGITAAPPGERTVDLSRYGSDREHPVLPLRLANDAMKKMDQTWVSKGYKSRMAFLREAIREKLAKLGADDAAALFA